MAAGFPQSRWFKIVRWALAIVAYLVGVSSRTPKGWVFDSQSRHIPRLWVQSPVGAHMGGNQCFAHRYFSLSKVKHFLKKFKEQSGSCNVFHDLSWNTIHVLYNMLVTQVNTIQCRRELPSGVNSRWGMLGAIVETGLCLHALSHPFLRNVAHIYSYILFSFCFCPVEFWASKSLFRFCAVSQSKLVVLLWI